MPKFRAYSHPLGRSGLEVCLEGPNSQFSLCPANGFKMYSAIYKGRQYIMPSADALSPGAGTGVPLLFPFPNRMRDCRYSFGGHDCVIKKNGMEQFLHGIVVDEPFAFEFGQDDSCAFAKGFVSIDEGKEYFSSYPFPCKLTVTYTLSEEGLKLSYEVENKGTQPLPYGFAHHAYINKFGNPDNVYIQAPVDQYYEAEQNLPTGKLLPVEGMFDLRKPVPVSSLRLDHVFHGFDESKEAVITYKEENIHLGLRASKEFKNMVIFTPPMLPGFCLENQTSATDYINLHNKGIDTSCIQIVEPGQTGSGWILARIF